MRNGVRARPAAFVRSTAGRVAAGIAGACCLFVALVVAVELTHIYTDRENLPALGPFVRFELPTVGHIYDSGGTPLIELAHEYREIARYDAIPPIVRDAILAAEDKRFFAHDGIDYASLPRIVLKTRVAMLAARLVTGGRHDDADDGALFPQGGSTITQQLVRGSFLRPVTALENSHELRSATRGRRLLSWLIGARSVNMLARKREEMRLSLWLEQAMRAQFGSKQRAKEEILARYASLVYMGHGQYGFARAADYYFGRRLVSFTAEDAGNAALLAGIAKSPRAYAPGATNIDRVVRRRNQTLALMQANGMLSPAATAAAQASVPDVRVHGVPRVFAAPAVVEHVLEEFKARHPDLSVEDLFQGRIQVFATTDVRIQRIVNDALERGLAAYETRHPPAAGIIQGSVVVLHNRDGRILAESGGRRVFNGRSNTYSDYNRVTRSLRQPGSAMKPMVYLAAFQDGGFTLDSVVPDEPISVPDGTGRPPKWIANYDGLFRGPMPIRQALAESRNAVAIWLTEQIGIDRVLQTSRRLGVRTRLERYPTTALGASEMNLLELANAYRAMASGITAEPYAIQAVINEAGEVVGVARAEVSPLAMNARALALIQEGLRGVVRLPSGTAHALASRAFPIAVMGKTGTTNDYRDAIFVGSTFGADGITVAVRIGFDDNRSLGSRETGGRLALPVFRQLMLAVYREDLLGAPPAFPAPMEARITAAVTPAAAPVIASAIAAADPEAPDPSIRQREAAAREWIRRNTAPVPPQRR